jgi:hypothetical protein
MKDIGRLERSNEILEPPDWIMGRPDLRVYR